MAEPRNFNGLEIFAVRSAVETRNAETVSRDVWGWGPLMGIEMWGDRGSIVFHPDVFRVALRIGTELRRGQNADSLTMSALPPEADIRASLRIGYMV
jgi:hypothetical protein